MAQVEIAAVIQAHTARIVLLQAEIATARERILQMEGGVAEHTYAIEQWQARQAQVAQDATTTE